MSANAPGVLIETIVNPAGLTLAKVVSETAAGRFADPGLGASPTWHAFAIDLSGIAFTDSITLVGDQRLRIDRHAQRPIAEGLSWAPASFLDQDGNRVAECNRGNGCNWRHSGRIAGSAADLLRFDRVRVADASRQLEAGARICWGTENREAAVRFLPATHGNPHGANVEVKVVDPSANPYLATAAILGLALDGIARHSPLPPEVGFDPQTLPDRQRIVQLSCQQTDAIAALTDSTLIRGILGDPVIDVLLAVRRYEQDTYGNLGPQELSDTFRMAWSL